MLRSDLWMLEPRFGPNRRLSKCRPSPQGISARWELRTLSQSPVAHAPPQIAMLEAPNAEPQIAPSSEGRGICIKTAAVSSSVAATSLVPPPAEFGLRLAEAAQAQVGGFVIYNDKYRSISYPMGDVPPLFGVCTDVVVRAYRALGLDLQELVHEAKSGSGDKNIDHRRTEVLRRFFQGSRRKPADHGFCGGLSAG